jgi:hypothetical protein
MTPGPTNPLNPNAKLDADNASLRKVKKENEAKLAQAEAEHMVLQNECSRIFIYENPSVAAEFTAYFTGSANVELEQLVKYQQAQLTAFEHRKALAVDFINRCGLKKPLEKAAEEKEERPLDDKNSDVPPSKLKADETKARASKKYRRINR